MKYKAPHKYKKGDRFKIINVDSCKNWPWEKDFHIGIEGIIKHRWISKTSPTSEVPMYLVDLNNGYKGWAILETEIERIEK